jgi:hypothetical protein
LRRGRGAAWLIGPLDCGESSSALSRAPPLFPRLRGLLPLLFVCILHAAKIDTFSNVWKLWVSRESMACLCLVGKSSRHPVMAAVNAS